MLYCYWKLSRVKESSFPVVGKNNTVRTAQLPGSCQFLVNPSNVQFLTRTMMTMSQEEYQLGCSKTRRHTQRCQINHLRQLVSFPMVWD